MRAGDRPVHITLGLNPYALAVLGLLVALAVITMASAFARVRARSFEQAFDAQRYPPLEVPGESRLPLEWRVVSGEAAGAAGMVLALQEGTVIVAGAPEADFRWVAYLETRGARSDRDRPPALLVRFANLDRHYRVYLTPHGELVLSKLDGGLEIQLKKAALGAAPFDRHRFEIEAQGGELRLTVDGDFAFAYKDPWPILSPAVGVMSRGGAAALTVLEWEALPR